MLVVSTEPVIKQPIFHARRFGTWLMSKEVLQVSTQKQQGYLSIIRIGSVGRIRRRADNSRRTDAQGAS